MEPRLLPIGATWGSSPYYTDHSLLSPGKGTARILFQEGNPQNWLMNLHLRCLKIFLQITLELCVCIETQMAP